MPVTTVHLTRVFDRVDNMGRGYAGTVFSFDSDCGTHYGVRVPGHPAIEAGMRVRAYLDKPGEWGSLVGWRNFDTGELAIEGSAVYWMVLSMIAAIVPVAFSPGGGAPLAWTGMLVVAMAALPIAALVKIRRVRRALLLHEAAAP